MQILEILAPIFLLVALGAALARRKFLGRDFIADLNRLVFYIALPSLVFISIAQAEAPSERTLLLVGIFASATLLTMLLGWITAFFLLKIPSPSVGTFVQGSFRGNLLFVGLPLLSYAFAELPAADQPLLLATTILVITPIMALFNVLSVIALQASQHQLGRDSVSLIIRSIGQNPLIMACLAGGIFMILGIPLPRFLARSLSVLGDAAVPLALICIGGSLATIQLTGNRRIILTAALLKVLGVPLFVIALAHLFGITGPEYRILLVLAACPTAAAAYIMARQMHGDESLASGSIALSTLLSAPALALVLWIS